MLSKLRPMLITTAIGLGASLLIPSEYQAEERVVPSTARPEMHDVFGAVAYLLPIAFSEVDWTEPAHRKETAKQLQLLADRAADLERHATVSDPGFRTLGHSLASGVREVRSLYDAEHFAESRFNLIEITGNCVACHSRLPAEDTLSVPESSGDPQLFDSLSPHEKAQILVATRRFLPALDVWENLFADTSAPPGQLDMEGYLLDYLTIGIRVRNDPERVRKTLARFARRPDMPLYLARHLDSWQRALALLAEDLGQGASLDRARALVAGEDFSVAPALGRERVIYDLVASSLLLRLMDRKEVSETELAEAYYLLGVVEARSVDSYWLPQAEFHLEAAIRLGPAADFAESAYALLEEYILIGYGGLTGKDLPLDVWTKLETLRQLVQQEATSPGPDGEIPLRSSPSAPLTGRP